MSDQPPAIPELEEVCRYVQAVFPDLQVGYYATGDLDSIVVAHYSIDRELDDAGQPVTGEWIVSVTLLTTQEPPAADLVEVARFNTAGLAAIRVVNELVRDALANVAEAMHLQSRTPDRRHSMTRTSVLSLRPVLAFGIVVAAVSMLFLSTEQNAEAGAANSLSISPALREVAPGSATSIQLVSEAPAQSLAAWVVEIAFDETVVSAGTCTSINPPAGSVAATRIRLPSSPLTATGAQMFVGGAAMLATGLIAGEGAAFESSAITTRSLLAWSYLVVFGSLVAFTAYTWLLRVSTPAKVSTYAFVNPLVAVLLGVWLAAEPLDTRTVVAMAVILTGVALIVLNRGRPARAPVIAAFASDARAGGRA